MPSRTHSPFFFLTIGTLEGDALSTLITLVQQAWRVVVPLVDLEWRIEDGQHLVTAIPPNIDEQGNTPTPIARERLAVLALRKVIDEMESGLRTLHEAVLSPQDRSMVQQAMDTVRSVIQAHLAEASNALTERVQYLARTGRWSELDVIFAALPHQDFPALVSVPAFYATVTCKTKLPSRAEALERTLTRHGAEGYFVRDDLRRQL